MATPSAGNSTMARRQLGRRLRRLREEAGKILADIDEAQIASRTKMWKIESGQVAVKAGDVLALTRFYEIDPHVTDELVALAGATRSTGFQEDHGRAVPEWVGLYGDLVDAAAALHNYSSELVHGLLQTADYARAVIATNPSFDARAVEQRVAFRLARQRAFFDRPSPGRLEVVVTAGALGVVVGSPAVMAAQIAHLHELSAQDRVAVCVLPATNGVHPAMRGPFTIMDFADPEDPPLVYLESLTGARYLERPDQLAVYREAFATIRARTVPLEEYAR